MALTVEQLKARREWLGSSDIPALLGVDRYRNLGDLFLEKTGRTEIRVTSNDAADWGDRLEPVVCEWLGERVGEEVIRGEHRSSQDGILRAQLDGWIPSLGETVEVKTSGLLNPRFHAEREGWGADGTDEVPFRVVAQVQFALMLAGAPRGHVAAFLGGGVGPRHYVIEAMPELQEEIERRARAFWTEHVLTGVQPEEIPSVETMKWAIRVPEKVAYLDFDSNLADDWMSVKTNEKAAKEAVAEVQARVLHALGDAEELQSPFGTWSYYANKRGTRTLRFSEKVTTTNE